MADEIRQRLGFDVSESLRNLALLRTSLGQTSLSLSTLARNGSKINQLGTTTQQSLQQATTAVTNFGSQTQAAANRATPAVTRLSVSFETLARVVQTQFIVRAMSALRDGLRDAVTEFIEFEKSIAQIETISSKSLGSFDDLAGTARGLAIAFNTPVLEQSRALYEAISNQVIKTRDDLTLLTEANLFAQATNSSVAESASLLAGAINAYGLETSRAGELASQFFRTLDLGAIEAEELGTAFGRVAPLARNVGISIGELNAALATLTIGGVKPAEAATQLRGILSDLVKPTDTMTKAFRELNVASAEELIQARGLLGALTALNSTTNGSTEEIAKLFDQVRGLSGELALTGRGLQTFADAQQRIIETTTDLSSEKGLGVLAKDAQTVDRAFNELAITFKQEVGKSLIEIAANVLRVSDALGVDFVKSIVGAGRVALPIMGDLAVAAGALGAAMGIAQLNALRAAPAFAAAAAAAGPLLAALLALRGGEFIGEAIGNQISDRFINKDILALKKAVDEQKRFEKEFTEVTIAELGKRQAAAEKFAAQRVITARTMHNAVVDEAIKESEEVREALEISLGAFIDAQQERVTELRQTASEAERAFEQSVDRATSLKQAIEDQKFERGLERLTSPQQISQILSVAQRSVTTTRRALSQISDPEEIEAALKGFERAEGLAKRAAELAKEAGDRRSLVSAETILLNLKKQQLQTEGQIQQLLKQRQAEAKKAEAQETARLAAMRKDAAKIVELFTIGKDGTLLDPKQLEQNQAQLQDAVRRFVGQITSADNTGVAELLGVVNLGARVNEQLSKAQIQQVTLAPEALQGIRDTLKETEVLLNARIANAEEVTRTFQDEINSKQELLKINASIQDNIFDRKVFDKFAAEVQSVNIGDLNPFTIFGGVGGARDDIEGMRQIGLQLQFAIQQGTLTKQVFDDLFRQFRDLKGADGIGGTDAALAQAFAVAQRMLERVGTFSQVADEINSSAESSASFARNMELTRTAAEGTKAALEQARSVMQSFGGAAATGRAQGGLIRFLAAGGFAGRGTDRIHAMLSRDEFVVNARSSRRFYSQLQAINSGQAPTFRSQGGPVTNVTIGDVNVQGGSTPSKTGRAIANELRRELRRGSIRGF